MNLRNFPAFSKRKQWFIKVFTCTLKYICFEGIFHNSSIWDIQFKRTVPDIQGLQFQSNTFLLPGSSCTLFTLWESSTCVIPNSSCFSNTLAVSLLHVFVFNVPSALNVFPPNLDLYSTTRFSRSGSNGIYEAIYSLPIPFFSILL